MNSQNAQESPTDVLSDFQDESMTDKIKLLFHSSSYGVLAALVAGVIWATTLWSRVSRDFLNLS